MEAPVRASSFRVVRKHKQKLRCVVVDYSPEKWKKNMSNRSVSLAGAQQQPQPHTAILVDLDNIAFHESRQDAHCLVRRIRAILHAMEKVSSAPCSSYATFFCNKKTHAFLVEHRFPPELLRMLQVSRASYKDAADHQLLAHLYRLSKSSRPPCRRDGGQEPGPHRLLAAFSSYFSSELTRRSGEC
jgi:hypothetical protein